MVTLLGHRQTKETETDKPCLLLPRHIPTLQQSHATNSILVEVDVKSLDKLSVSTRLALIAVIVVIGMAAASGVALFNLKENLLEDRRIKTRHVVETALGSLQYFQSQQQQGALSEVDAKRMAIAAMKLVRYDQKEYFWIQDQQGMMVMHPIKPELDGSMLLELTDPTGKKLFAEMRTVANAQGAGYVEYQWPKPGSATPVSKISYVANFAPWNWVVGSGIYIDDVNAVFYRQAMISGGTSLLVLALVVAVSILISRGIVRQLGGEPAVAAAAVVRIADGDLTGRINHAQVPKGSMLYAMGEMQNKLAAIFAEINGMVGTLSAGADQLATSAHEVSLASGAQAQSTSATAASVEELTVSINEVSEMAKLTEANSAHTAMLAEQGSQVVKEAAEAITAISTTVAASAGKIQLLMQRSLEIGGIANVIKEIADQTNLLALNAAIEAARAGEQGRGFAVVADEVRKLAERTTGATNEIAKMIDSIQQDTEVAVKSMDATSPQVAKGFDLTTRVSDLLNQISQQAIDSLDRVREVAAATKEQSATATDIAIHIERIASAAEETNNTTQGNSTAAAELDGLAERLRTTVSYFRV
jgi:methyl-accepting chemotaxis protein